MQYPNPAVSNLEFRPDLTRQQLTNGDPYLHYNVAALGGIDPIIPEMERSLMQNELKSIQANTGYKGTCLQNNVMLNQNTNL